MGKSTLLKALYPQALTINLLHAGDYRRLAGNPSLLKEDEVAIEVKSTEEAQSHHLKGLRALLEEYRVKRAILVTRDSRARKVGEIDILPWKLFLQELWADKLL